MFFFKQVSLDRFVETTESINDWDFAGADTQYATHGIHPYPARMIPQIANRLINNYSLPYQTVLDPFCGSGGVLVESRLNSRNSIGVDINPLALFLAKVKTTPIDPDRLQIVWQKLKQDITTEIQRNKRPQLVVFPKELHIERWFKPRVISHLAIIRRIIEEIEDDDIKDFFLATFSGTVRFTSNNRPNEYKVYRLSEEELKKHNPDVLKKFIEHTEKCIEGMKDFYKQCDMQTSVELKLADTRNLPLQNESVDLIVTSPPYGDSHTTVGYGQFSKYLLIWLSFDGYKIKRLQRFDWEMARKIDFELGLGGNAFGEVTKEILEITNESETLYNLVKEIDKTERELKAKHSRIPALVRYFYDLRLCLFQMYRVLRNDGHSCIVIGNRSVRGIRIATDKIVTELAEGVGYKTEKIIFRNIPSKRHPIRQRWMLAGRPQTWIDNILRESIIILKK
jgi:site-specific DNA-methyltransferase (cytosine-N4-specific)